MNIDKLEKSLEVTQAQIDRLDDIIADTVKTKDEIDPGVYESMLVGYTEIKNELTAEANKYRMELEYFQINKSD